MPEDAPDYTAEAQAAAQEEHDAVVGMADRTFGEAVRCRTGLIVGRDATTRTLTVAAATGEAWSADWGGLTVPVSAVGQTGWFVVDPVSGRAHFRFVVGG